MSRLSAGADRTAPGLAPAQLRTLFELDQAVAHLLHLAATAAAPPPAGSPGDDSPRSLREGLTMLQVRTRNLQRSFGLEPIPAAGRPFDDRWHRAHGVVERPDLPDGMVVEEVLPGYRLGERALRPALVIVNHRHDPDREENG